MDSGEEPECVAASRQWLGYPVILLCDRCNRVQDGLSESANEEAWKDQPGYLSSHHASPTLVWWWHTVCRQCGKPTV